MLNNNWLVVYVKQFIYNVVLMNKNDHVDQPDQLLHYKFCQ